MPLRAVLSIDNLSVWAKVIYMNDLPKVGPPDQGNESEAPKGSARGDTRKRLLDAASSLFIAKGFYATRPQDISRAAGVGHGTFYLHFKDKQACFVAFAEQAAEALEAYVETHASGSDVPYEVIRESILLTYDFAAANPGILAVALTDLSVINGGEAGSLLMERWGNQWHEQIKGWQEAGLVGPHVNSEYVGHAIPGMIRTVGQHAGVVDAPRGTGLEALMAFLVVGLGLKEDDF